MSVAFGATKIRHLLKSKLNVWNWHKNICCCSVTHSCPTLYHPWTAACQASLSFSISQSLLKLMSIESMMPSNHPILCYPLLIPSIFPSIRVFSSESALHIRWPEYWSFSICPSNEYSGLVSFRVDLFDLLTVQRTLKSLRQHQNSKASILRLSAFFMVQLSHPNMTTRKTIALTRLTFVGEVTSLLFNTLSRFVIAFLPRSMCLWISEMESNTVFVWVPPEEIPQDKHLSANNLFRRWSQETLVGEWKWDK